MDLRSATIPMYGVVVAHREGAAVERVLMSTITTDLVLAQTFADTWTRHHGHSDLDTDRSGFYAYADRVTQARAPEVGSSIRIPVGTA